MYNRLYKLALFDTFEAYTRARWDISRVHAYRLIKYCEVIHNLSPIGEVLSANESQVRYLAPGIEEKESTPLHAKT